MERADTGVLDSIPCLTLFLQREENAQPGEKRGEGCGEVTQGEVTYPKWWLNRGRTRACKSLPTVLLQDAGFLLFWKAGAASVKGR